MRLKKNFSELLSSYWAFGFVDLSANCQKIILLLKGKPGLSNIFFLKCMNLRRERCFVAAGTTTREELHQISAKDLVYLSKKRLAVEFLMAALQSVFDFLSVPIFIEFKYFLIYLSLTL